MSQGHPEESVAPAGAAALTLRRLVAVGIYEVIVSPEALAGGHGWKSGPFDVAVTDGERADSAWRSRFVHARVQRPLYGDGRRFHRVMPLDDPVEIPGTRVSVAGAELCRFRGAGGCRTNALLALHLDINSQGRALIGDLKVVARNLNEASADGVAEVVERLLPSGCHLYRREPNATLLVFASHSPNSALSTASTWQRSNSEAWSAVDAWRWGMAMATPPSRAAIEDPVEPITPGTLVRMPRRDAQVVNRGVAIFATRPDTRARQSSEYEKDVKRTQTLFLDALLLGVTQRVLVAQLVDDVAACGDPASNQRAFQSVQHDVRIFRNRFWWREFSSWTWPDEILRAYQSEHEIAPQFEQLVSEVSDYADGVETVNTQRTNLSLALIALIGMIGVVASVLQATGVNAERAAAWLGYTGAVVLVPMIIVVGSLLRSYSSRGSPDRLEA